ncbi:MAG: hypothetical protein J6D21_09875 [Clostridia bacterium]|nr:hypothetical protein [Clostridia bacterium]
MKNFWLKTMALVLCILMVLPTLAACGEQGASTTPVVTTPVPTTPAPTTPAATTPAATTPAVTTPAVTTPADTTPAGPSKPTDLPTDIVKIEVNPDLVVDEFNCIDPRPLFDETNSVGDPAAGTGKVPSSSPTGSGSWQDLSVVVDLGADYHISYIYYYPKNTDTTIGFATRLDRLEDWSDSVESTSPAKAEWVKVDMDTEAHYLYLTGANPTDAPREIVIYGYRTGYYDELPDAIERVYPTIGDLMGINGLINDNPRHLAAVTYLREYHNWLWTEHWENWEKGTSSTYFTGTNVGNFDTFYLTCANKDISVIPCLQWTGGVSVFENGGTRPSMPLADGTYEPENPHTYYTYAGEIYQYVARYGNNKFITDTAEGEDHEHDWGKWVTDENNSKIKHRTCKNCSAAQTQDYTTLRTLSGKQTGLGYLDYIELGNEPNGGDQYNSMTPWQLAAHHSASYDGHEGTMGAGYGAIYADPDTQVAMAGLAGCPVGYIRSMAMWAKLNRQDGDLPFDIINVHTYCRSYINVNGNNVAVGSSPESFGLVESLQELIDWRDTYYPDKQIWLTEFGWDTNEDYLTEQSSHSYGEYTSRQVQAMWMVRSYLLLSASGVDRAFWYMCGGGNDDSVGKYGTCGVIDGKGQKKDSWYYMNTLHKTIGDMSFQEDFESGHRDVMVYRYMNEEGKNAYVLWCPTADGTKVENYELHLCGATTAELVEFANLEDTGIHSDLTVDANGKVTVTVSECPIIILAE